MFSSCIGLAGFWGWGLWCLPSKTFCSGRGAIGCFFWLKGTVGEWVSQELGQDSSGVRLVIQGILVKLAFCWFLHDGMVWGGREKNDHFKSEAPSWSAGCKGSQPEEAMAVPNMDRVFTWEWGVLSGWRGSYSRPKIWAMWCCHRLWCCHRTCNGRYSILVKKSQVMHISHPPEKEIIQGALLRTVQDGCVVQLPCLLSPSQCSESRFILQADFRVGTWSIPWVFIQGASP